MWISPIYPLHSQLTVLRAVFVCLQQAHIHTVQTNALLVTFIVTLFPKIDQFSYKCDFRSMDNCKKRKLIFYTLQVPFLMPVTYIASISITFVVMRQNDKAELVMPFRFQFLSTKHFTKPGVFRFLVWTTTTKHKCRLLVRRGRSSDPSYFFWQRIGHVK